MYDVICYGAISLDISGKLEFSWPESGQASAKDYCMSVGGDAAIISIMLSGLGLKVGLAGGPIGNDPMGDYLKERISSYGVDFLANAKGKSSIAFIIIDEAGNRSILTFHDDTPEEEIYVPVDAIKSSRYVYCDGCYGKNSLKIGHISKRSGSRSILNLGVPSIQNIGFFDEVIANEQISRIFSLDHAMSARSLHDINNGIAVVTSGEKGCIYCIDEPVSVPSFKISSVDTTGAGAAFISGFIYAGIKGFPLHERILFASAAGAYKSLERGSFRIFSEKDIENFLKDYS
jgi:sugar/nucleoside kinase (ribokinase family)